MVLEGVTFGTWGEQSWSPGFALSPDGRQVAVYDGRTNRLTLIDARRMSILRFEIVSPPQSFVHRVARWLGIEPTAAVAKGVSDGAALQIRYSPDGRLLYVTGYEHPSGAILGGTTPIGIRAIDIGTGEISGESLKSQTLWWVQLALDGSALYAFSLTGDDSEPFPTILRLDPRTLQIAAQHVVTLHNSNPAYYLLATSSP
jgi:hypothetical protein